MKRFLVILGLTAVVWLALSMSERREFFVQVRVQPTGYDTARYLLRAADTLVTLRVEASGYAVFRMGVGGEPTVRVEMKGDGLRRSVSAEEVCEKFRREWKGVLSADCSMDSIRWVLAERGSRSFKPSIEGVQFAFAEQYGLYGQPVVSPAEVVLYGEEESLKSIAGLRVKPTTVSHVNHSETYVLPLEPVWEGMPNVHPSCEEVSVYVPVERFEEYEYKVPIRVEGADPQTEIRLYPAEATLHVWVAERDKEREPQFGVSIDYADILSDGMHVRLRLDEFPGYVRPRSMEPKEVKCVVIR